MDKNQFLDLTQDREVIAENRKTGKEGEEINCLKIKELQSIKDGQEHVFLRWKRYSKKRK
jgi:hypothetical protein